MTAKHQQFRPTEGEPPSVDLRARLIQQVVEECLCRRAGGDRVTDEAFCVEHADLLPELAEELRMLQVIERARTSRGLSASEREREAPGDPATDALRAGRDVFPGYELLDELHRGGQGIIYRAVQRSTGRRVALKVLLEGAFAGSLDRARFKREISVLAALQHQNIVTIHDSGSASGRFFFAMDYIAGQPVDVYMSSAPRSIEESLRLFLKICDAVNAAHVRGIIHRDLKPANIRVDERGEPYVLDFGLARMTESAARDGAVDHPSMTRTGQFIGSLPWAAPEQAAGSSTRVDTRSDVYSLGVLLFQMLTGKFPYSVVGPIHDVVRRITSDAPLSPRRLRPEIDDELGTILLRCLAKSPERRYQTAGELGRDVLRYLNDEPIEAKRDSAWYMLRKTLVRFKLPLAVASLFFLLLAASTAVSWSLWRAATLREAEAQANLRASLMSQARAVRHTRALGRRDRALEALAGAAAIRTNIDLRNEMIATLALPDARPREIDINQKGMAIFDATLARCAVVSPNDSRMTVVRVPGGAVLVTIPALALGSQLQRTVLAGDFLARVFDTVDGSRNVEVWRISDARLFLEFDDVPPLGGFDLAPDGLTLAVGRSDSAVHVYDLDDGTRSKRIPVDRMPSRMTFDPTGRRLVLYHGAYQRAALLDLESQACGPVFGAASIGWSVSWSPGATMLAGAENNQIQLWDLTADRSAGVLRGHEHIITHVAISPDGRRLLSRSWDDITIAWSLTTRRPLFETRGALLSFSPDGGAIAGWMPCPTESSASSCAAIMDLTGDAECRMIWGPADPDALALQRPALIRDDTIVMTTVISEPRPDLSGLYFVDVHGGRQLAGLPLGMCELASLDPAGRSISAFVYGRGLLRWPLAEEGAAPALGTDEVLLSGKVWLGAARSGDGRVVAFSDAPGRVGILDMDQPSVMRQFPCDPGAHVLALSSDARFVVVAEWHKPGAGIWNTETETRVATLSTGYWAAAAFSSDDRRLTIGDGKGLGIWDTTNWVQRARREGAHALPTYSRDGRFIAAVAGQEVRLYDGNTLTPLCTLGPPEPLTTTGLAISADGSRVVQMSNRAGVGYVWDVAALRASLAAHGLDWN